MSQDYHPEVWDWEPIVKGCTYQAANIIETPGEEPTETILNRVLIVIQERGSDVNALVLDSDDEGVTINNSAAGEWDYTVDKISAATVEGLAVGLYDVTQFITHNTDEVICVSKGTWEILPK